MSMQVVDIYEKADFRHNASFWYRWKSEFGHDDKLFIYMIKLIRDKILVVGRYDQAYLTNDGSSWYRW